MKRTVRWGMRTMLWLLAVCGAACAHGPRASTAQAPPASSASRDDPSPTDALREAQAALRTRLMSEMRQLYRAGDYDGALAILETLLKRGVDDLGVRRALTNTAHRLGSHKLALRHARAAYAHAARSRHGGVTEGLAVARQLGALGRDPEALAWLQALLVEHPEEDLIRRRIEALGGTPATPRPIPSLPARAEVRATLSAASAPLGGCVPAGRLHMRIDIDGPRGRGSLVSVFPALSAPRLDCLEAVVAQLAFPVFGQARLEILYPIDVP